MPTAAESFVSATATEVGNEIQSFVTALTAKVQKELADLAAEVTYTTAVHVARASVAGLAQDVRDQVEDEVADILDIS